MSWVGMACEESSTQGPLRELKRPTAWIWFAFGTIIEKETARDRRSPGGDFYIYLHFLLLVQLLVRGGSNHPIKSTKSSSREMRRAVASLFNDIAFKEEQILINRHCSDVSQPLSCKDWSAHQLEYKAGIDNINAHLVKPGLPFKRNSEFLNKRIFI